MTAGTMSAFMDQLVGGARSSRDAAFNTLDAVERQTRAANSQLAARVQKFVADHPAEAKKDDAAEPEPTIAPAPAERDARFDPEEDEWDVAGPDTTAPPPASTAPRFGRDEDDDDFPDTWLR